jgi:hypothetical protein
VCVCVCVCLRTRVCFVSISIRFPSSLRQVVFFTIKCLSHIRGENDENSCLLLYYIYTHAGKCQQLIEYRDEQSDISSLSSLSTDENSPSKLTCFSYRCVYFDLFVYHSQMCVSLLNYKLTGKLLHE